MRRKKKLYAITMAALTMMSGAGPRTFAAVPPETNVEKEAEKPEEERQKPEATVPPGEAGYEDADQKTEEQSDEKETETASSVEEAEEANSGMETPEATDAPEESSEETPEPTESTAEPVTETPESTGEAVESGAETPEPTEEAVESETEKVTESAQETPQMEEGAESEEENSEEPEVTGTGISDLTESIDEEPAGTETVTGTPKAKEEESPTPTEQVERPTATPVETDKPDSTDDKAKESEEKATTVAAPAETVEPTQEVRQIVIVTPTAGAEPRGKTEVVHQPNDDTVPKDSAEAAKVSKVPEETETKEKSVKKKQEDPPEQAGKDAQEEDKKSEKDKTSKGKTDKDRPMIKPENQEQPDRGNERVLNEQSVQVRSYEQKYTSDDNGQLPKFAEQQNSNEQQNRNVQEMIQDVEQKAAPPEIRVDGVRNRATSQSPVDLSAHIKDRDRETADVHAVIKDTETGKIIEGNVIKNQDGYKVTFPKVSDDGHYQMTVQTKNERGQVSSEKKVAFTVNQHGGAAYLATEDLAGARVNRPVSPEFVVADVDENAGLRATVNGRQVGTSYNKEGKLVLDEAITKEGRYVVRVEGRDSAGHEIKSRPVEFVIDKTKPRVWLKTKATDRGLIVEIFHDIPEDSIESVIVDDKALKKEDYTDQKGRNRFILDKEGAHTVKVTVKDAAGNKTERTQALRAAARHSARKKSGHLKIVWIAFAACAAGAVLICGLIFWRLIRH